MGVNMFIYKSELGVIARNSLIDCHVKGMDSIVFDNTPGKRVRAFIAQKDHTLWQNLPVHGERLSLAIHSHHCDLTISRMFGKSYNVAPEEYVNAGDGWMYPAWKYQSHITTGKGGFVHTPERNEVFVMAARELYQPIEMKARDIHTWYVPYGREAAWLVREGKEDSKYDSTCWSDADLTKFDTSSLYQPMSVDYLKIQLDKMKVHIL
jgi:hypothetical protein